MQAVGLSVEFREVLCYANKLANDRSVYRPTLRVVLGQHAWLRLH